MYIFKLQKGTLLLILGLLGLAGALTFTAGMAVGVRWTLSNPALEAMLEGDAAPGPSGGRTMPAVTPRPAAPAPGVRPAAAPTVTVPAVPATPPAGVSLVAAVEPTPAPPVQEAASPEPAVAAAEEPAEPNGDPRFAVQVGAFLYEENSAKMLAELLGRGYEPYVVKKTSSDDRILDTVRFGHYPSFQLANLAASEFMAKEGLDTAIVREPGVQ